MKERLCDLILSSTDNECTASPYWYITNSKRPQTILKGIWFSRDEAERHLKMYAHRYPKTAFVYCGSGNESDIEMAYRRAALEVAK